MLAFPLSCSHSLSHARILVLMLAFSFLCSHSHSHARILILMRAFSSSCEHSTLMRAFSLSLSAFSFSCENSHANNLASAAIEVQYIQIQAFLIDGAVHSTIAAQEPLSINQRTPLISLQTYVVNNLILTWQAMGLFMFMFLSILGETERAPQNKYFTSKTY